MRIPNEATGGRRAGRLTTGMKFHPFGMADATITFLRPEDRVRPRVDTGSFAGVVADLEAVLSRAVSGAVSRHDVDGGTSGGLVGKDARCGPRLV